MDSPDGLGRAGQSAQYLPPTGRPGRLDRKGARFVELMHNRIRPYAWGSRTAIAELIGAPSPSPHPQAELWIGAHPADSSLLIDEHGDARSLAEVISADPVGHPRVRAPRRGSIPGCRS